MNLTTILFLIALVLTCIYLAFWDNPSHFGPLP